MSGDGIKKSPHDATALNIARLRSPMARSCNVCNVLKFDTHERFNIAKNMHKSVSKLHFKNNPRKYHNVGE